jgi:hypothetical protein
MSGLRFPSWPDTTSSAEGTGHSPRYRCLGPEHLETTLNIDLVPIVAYAAAHPWTVMALLLILGVLLPGVWSSRPERRAAAGELVDRLLTAIADIAEALARPRRR